MAFLATERKDMGVEGWGLLVFRLLLIRCGKKRRVKKRSMNKGFVNNYILKGGKVRMEYGRSSMMLLFLLLYPSPPPLHPKTP